MDAAAFSEMVKQLNQNKAAVRNYVETMWSKKDVDAAMSIFAEDYIEHMPSLPGGLAHTRAVLAGMLEQFPDCSATLHHIIAEGDLVAFTVNWKPTPDSPGTVSVDTIRFKDGKAVEHWNVMQPVPTGADKVNPISIF